MPNDLLSSFDEYFEIITADSPELLEQALRLRYTVYCINKQIPGFEAAHCSDGMETDDYDRHAHHILLKHRPSGKLIGSARLILPDPSNPAKLFPIEQHGQTVPGLLDIRKSSRHHTVEFSRFITLDEFFRDRKERLRSENRASEERCDPSDRRHLPYSLALSVGVIRMCVQKGITQGLSAMRPALNKLLGIYGLHHDPIGPIVDYHGPRRLYCFEISKVLDRLHTNNREIWELVTNQGKIQPLSTGQTLDQALLSSR